MQLLALLISLILVSFLIYQIWKLPFLEAKLQKLCKHFEITSYFWDVLVNKTGERIIYGLYYSPVEGTMQQQFINMQHDHIVSLKEVMGQKL